MQLARHTHRGAGADKAFDIGPPLRFRDLDPAIDSGIAAPLSRTPLGPLQPSRDDLGCVVAEPLELRPVSFGFEVPEGLTQMAECAVEEAADAPIDGVGAVAEEEPREHAKLRLVVEWELHANERA